MKYQAILFDKDGTLIDLRYLWALVYIRSAESVFGLSPDQKLLDRLGVVEGSVRRGSVMETSTPKQVFGYIYESMRERHFDAGETRSDLSEEEKYERYAEKFLSALKRITREYRSEAAPMSHRVPEIFQACDSLGVPIGVITADVLESTKETMELCGLAEYISYYGTSDAAIAPKPSPAQGIDFCQRFGIDSGRVLMVGDTYNDRLFAENSGFDYFEITSAESWEELWLTLDFPRRG